MNHESLRFKERISVGNFNMNGKLITINLVGENDMWILPGGLRVSSYEINQMAKINQWDLKIERRA